MYQMLVSLLEQKSEISKAAKEEELWNKKFFKGGDFKEHLKALNCMHKEANDAGCNISKGTIVSIIIMFLPMLSCWAPATMMYQSIPNSTELGYKLIDW
jgi:hypothetical protein